MIWTAYNLITYPYIVELMSSGTIIKKGPPRLVLRPRDFHPVKLKCDIDTENDPIIRGKVVARRRSINITIRRWGYCLLKIQTLPPLLHFPIYRPWKMHRARLGYIFRIILPPAPLARVSHSESMFPQRFRLHHNLSNLARLGLFPF